MGDSSTPKLDPELAGLLLRTLFADSPDAIGVSRDAVIEMVNPAAVELFGYDGEPEMLGRAVLDLIAPEAREMIAEFARRRAADEEVPAVYETTGVRRDGSRFPMELRSTTYRLRGQTYTFAFLRDVTERRAAERAIRDSEDFYRALFEVNTAVKLLICPTSGYIVDANRAAVEFYGWSLDELRSMRITDINQLTADEVKAEMANARSGRRRYFRFRHLVADGSIRHVEVHSGPVDIEGRKLLLSIVHDVTERDELEEQLRRAQRLESIGRLAGGVAHDFNNLLTVMLTSADFVARKMDPASQLRQYIDDLRHAARRAADLTNGLLAFSRRQVMQPAPVRIDRLVEQTTRLLRRTIEPSIEIRTEIEDGVPAVHADPSRLEQVLINLALNARDAMPDGGTLGLRIAERELRDREDVVPPGRWVVMSISDTGEGMDEDTRARVFEPFFTTKETGSGTGLGLSTVYGIVVQSGGHITVSTAPGRGSEFTVFLPSADDEPPTPRAVTPPPVLRTGAHRVLLVEDVEPVRAVVAEALEESGIEVWQTATAEEALELPAAVLHRLDALVSDVVMPGRSGIELAEELLGRRPDLHVLLVSGHVRDHDHGRLPEHVELMQKPFVADDLVRRLHAMLRGGGDGQGG